MLEAVLPKPVGGSRRYTQSRSVNSSWLVNFAQVKHILFLLSFCLVFKQINNSFVLTKKNRFCVGVMGVALT